MSETTQWIYKCGTEWKYCKDGFCGRYNELKEAHKRPAVEMSKEWAEATGQEWKSGAIQTQFDRLTNTKCVNQPTPIEKFSKKMKNALRQAKKIKALPEYEEYRRQLIKDVNLVLITFMDRREENAS